MSTRITRTLLPLFTSILLVIAIFSFTPLPHFASPLLQKTCSFFKHFRLVNVVNDDHKELGRPLLKGHGVRPYKLREWMPKLQDKPVVDDSIIRLDKPIFNTFVDHEDCSNKPVADEKDVVVLTNSNFNNFVGRHQYVMVNFYASWCYWSRRLAPEYAAAATMLKGEAVLAKVEASEEKELASKYDIQGYPTVYLLVGGAQKVHYYGDRTRDAITNWVRQKMGLVNTVMTTEKAKLILATSSVRVLGILENLEGPESEELAAASKLHIDVDFYQTANFDVARLFQVDSQIKRPALVMLKEEAANHSHVAFDGLFTRSAIANFVSIHKRPSVITFSEEDASYIFDSPMGKLFLFASKCSWELMSTFQEVANALKGKLLFVLVETNHVGARLAYEFGVTKGAPRVVACNEDGRAKKYVYRGEMTFSGIKSFAEEFLEDKLSRQSAPVMEEGHWLALHTSDPTSIPHAY